MVEEPGRFVEEFVEAGSDCLIIHQESTVHLHRAVQHIKALGKRAGVAINPATPAILLEEILPNVNLVLVMTVNPGFGGQKFIRTTPPKIRRVRQMIDQQKLACELEVNGGIESHTALLAIEAATTVLAACSALFDAGDGVLAAVARLREEIGPGDPCDRSFD